jgi:glycosyltransferase involved in cell wall biosynthesis
VRWLVLEPYYGGSHRHLVDGLCARLPRSLLLWTMPPRKWKWRMRGAAAHFARRVREEQPAVGGIWASSMLNLAELKGLLPPGAAALPCILYLHENQLRYPLQRFDRRDHHFAWSNLLSALAADRVLWNSRYNHESFFEDAGRLVRKMPDFQLEWALDAIAAKSEIVPVPLDVFPSPDADVPRARTGPCHIVWNHRWEYDKGPEALLAAVSELVRAELPFEMSVLGQRFDSVPPHFDRLREVLAGRTRQWGYLEDRGAYQRCLREADVVLSTAHHEFQGLAVLEGAACGAVPLVPDALCYPEIWPPEFRYVPGRLLSALRDRIERVEHWRRVDPRPWCEPFDWTRQLPAWRRLLRLERAA